MKMGSGLQILSPFQHRTGCNIPELKSGNFRILEPQLAKGRVWLLKNNPTTEKGHVLCQSVVGRFPEEVTQRPALNFFLGEFSRAVGE